MEGSQLETDGRDGQTEYYVCWWTLNGGHGRKHEQADRIIVHVRQLDKHHDRRMDMMWTDIITSRERYFTCRFQCCLLLASKDVETCYKKKVNSSHENVPVPPTCY